MTTEKEARRRFGVPSNAGLCFSEGKNRIYVAFNNFTFLCVPLPLFAGSRKVALGCLLAVFLPCGLIGSALAFENERAEFFDSGPVVKQPLLEAVIDRRFVVSSVVPSDVDDGERRRESRSEFGACSGMSVAVGDDARRSEADKPAKTNAGQTDKGVANVKSALYCHLLELLFMAFVIPAWLLGWKIGEWSDRRFNWVKRTRKW